MRGQYSCVSHPAKGARVLAGSTLLYDGTTCTCKLLDGSAYMGARTKVDPAKTRAPFGR